MAGNGSARKGTLRACERCRKSRVKCLIETVEKHGKCKRCYQTNSDCVFRPETNPQPRKRATARTSSLESRLNAVTAALEKKLSSHPSLLSNALHQSHDQDGSTLQSRRSDTIESVDHNLRKDLSAPQLPSGEDGTATHSLALMDSSLSNRASETIPGYVESTLLSVEQAAELFSDFQKYAIVEHPLLTLDQDATFESMRESKPLLLYAVITTAARGKYPRIFEQLHRRLQRVVVDETILGGQKSLEWIQVILLLLLWYCIPEDINRINFFQWIHIAGAMALHIGLIGTIDHGVLSKSANDSSSSATDYQKEVWRTGIAICISVSTISMSLHRQAMFTLTKNAQKFLDALEMNATTVNDMGLVAWGRLQLIAEKAENIKIKFDDTSVKATLWIEIRSLENRFDEWKESVPPGVMTASLEIHYLYCRCRMYELFMLDGELSTAVVHGTSLPSTDSTKHRQPTHGKITPSLVKTVGSVVHSCHDIIDRLCQIDVSIYLHFPTVTTIRALYALNTLSILRTLSNKPQHALSVIIDNDTISFPVYLNRLKAFLRRAIEQNEEHKVPRLIYNTLDRVATQPVFTQHGKTYSQQVEHGGSDQNEPHNDFEAVFNSNVFDQDGGPEASSSVPPQGSISTILQPITDQSVDTLSGFIGNPPNFEDFQLLDGINLDDTFGHDLEQMCMPDFVTGANSWFDNSGPDLQKATTSLDPNKAKLGFPAWTPY